MSFKFDAKEIRNFITMSPDSEELIALEEEYLEGYDPTEPLRAHKMELEDLEELLSTLETVKKEFDPMVHAREAAENAYSATIYLLYHLARRFHPLSEYGKDLMLKAYKLRQEYEKMFKAPMITGISAENCEVFKELISEDILEDISLGTCSGIGLFRTDVDRLVPVGAVAFTWTELPEDYEEGPVIDVKWFYIDEDYRKGSLADLLIGELVTLMIRKKASDIMFSVPVDEYYETWLQLFAEWKFEVSTGLSPDYRMSVRDIESDSKILAFNESATAFNDIAPEKMDIVVRNFLKTAEDMEILEKVAGRGDYYDRDLSCFTGTESLPTGLLLAHRKPSNDIDIEYIGYLEEMGETVMSLVGSCAYAALSKFKAKPDIIMHPFTEELEIFIDRFLPEAKVVPMINGSMLWPEGLSLTAEMVDAIMDSLEEEEEA